MLNDDKINVKIFYDLSLGAHSKFCDAHKNVSECSAMWKMSLFIELIMEETQEM